VTTRTCLRTTGLTDIQLVGVICVHAAKWYGVAKLCRGNKTNKEFAKVRTSLEQATTTH